MTFAVFKKFLGLFAMAAFLLGQGVAVTFAAPGNESVMYMDGSFSGAMNHKDKASEKKPCTYKDCNHCDNGACQASSCSSSPVLPEALTALLGKVSQVQVPNAFPLLTGIERQYLPLPPP